MHLWRVTRFAAFLMTGALALTLGEYQVSSRAKNEVERLFAGRHDLTVAAVSANLLTQRLTLNGLVGIAGRWQVSIGQLQLPLPNDGIGLFAAANAFPMGGSAEDKPAPESPPSVTIGSASAENVMITDGPTTYHVKRIDLVGTPLSNQDLAALLDPAKPDPVESRLRKLTAASITIPELTAESTVGSTQQHFVQKQILFANVAQGKVALGSVGISSIAVKGDNTVSNTEFGSLQLAGIDLGQIAHVFAATRTDESEKLLPMYESATFNAAKVTDAKTGQVITIGSIKTQGLDGRAFKTDLRTQSTKLASVKQDDPAASSFLADLSSSVSVKLVEVDDLAILPSSAEHGDFTTFGIEQIATRDIGESHQIGEIGMRNLHFEGKQGRMALASATIGGVSLPQPAPIATSPTDASVADPKKPTDATPAYAKMPIVAKLKLSHLSFDMNVANKGEADQRVAFAVEDIDYSATGLEVGRIPANGAVSVNHVTFDVPPNDPSMEALRSLGYKHVDVSSHLASSYDAQRQTLAIDKLVLGGIDMGSMDLKLDLNNVSDKVVSSNPEVQKASAIAVLFKGADLIVRNDGLIERTLKHRAEIDGKSVEDEKTAYIDLVTNQLPLIAGGSPKLKPLEDALATFITTPKTLHVSIATKNGLGVADMALLNDPNGLLDQLEIQATANE